MTVINQAQTQASGREEQLEALWLALAEERYQRELAQCEAARVRVRLATINPTMAHAIFPKTCKEIT